MNRTAFRGRRRRGGALVATIVLVSVCAALAGSSLVTGLGRHRESEAEMHRERAYGLADAGIDWGISQVRQGGGTLPSAASSGNVPSCGHWQVSYLSGTENDADDDGDGAEDESDEDRFSILRSTGTSGAYRRTLEVVLLRPDISVDFGGATQFNVDAPILDVNGNAFRIAGEEHLLDGTVDATRPPRLGVASPAPAAVIVSQIPANRRANVTGLGGAPSVGTVLPIDLDALVEQAARAASVLLPPGTHTNGNWGTPTDGGTTILYCDGDLHLSSSNTGAGILVVDGDLSISGGFEWVGIILVRGRATMTGGGAGKRIVGTLVVGEEIDSNSDSQEITVSGTIDLFYSSDAIALATGALSVPVVAACREVGSP